MHYFITVVYSTYVKKGNTKNTVKWSDTVNPVLISTALGYTSKLYSLQEQAYNIAYLG